MNELVELDGPATMVECPWCDGPVEIVSGSSAMVCDGCGIVLEIASDGATMAAWAKDASAMHSRRPDAAWPLMAW